MREWWSGGGSWQCQVQFVGDDDCCWLGCRGTPVYLTTWEPQPLSPLVVIQCNFRHTCARILTFLPQIRILFAEKQEGSLYPHPSWSIPSPEQCLQNMGTAYVDWKVVQLSHSSRPPLEVTHPSVTMAEVCSSCFCSSLVGICTPHSTLWPCWRKTMIHNFSPHWTWAMVD